MNSGKKFVVVAWDFTDESEKALAHAAQLAQVMGNGIALLQLIHAKKSLFRSIKGISPEEEAALLKRMEDKAKEVADKYKLEVKAVVRQGDVTKIIGETLAALNANLVVMSIHHKFGVFELKGDGGLDAMKEAVIPFILTQNAPQHQYYKEMVVAIDHDRKYKETIAWIINLAHYYRCNVNIIKPYITDEFQKKDMANNIYFTKKMLDKANIVYGIKTAKKSQPYKDEIFHFAEVIDADIVVMMAKQYRKWLDKDASIDVSGVPVMVIPPRGDIAKFSRAFT